MSSDLIGTCVQCGASFTVIKSHQVYCSRKCRDKVGNALKNARRSQQRKAQRGADGRVRGVEFQIHRKVPRKANQTPVVIAGTESKHVKGTFTWAEFDAEYEAIVRTFPGSRYREGSPGRIREIEEEAERRRLEAA